MATEQTAVWTDEQYAAYALGMRTERELQEALARLAMEKHQAIIAAQAARIEELEGTLDQVATESDMIFDRGAQRLARIKELEAELAAAQQRRWEPVPDGEYEGQHTNHTIIVDGEWLTISEPYWRLPDDEEPSFEEATLALPEDYALCRRVQEEGADDDNA